MQMDVVLEFNKILTYFFANIFTIHKPYGVWSKYSNFFYIHTRFFKCSRHVVLWFLKFTTAQCWESKTLCKKVNNVIP